MKNVCCITLSLSLITCSSVDYSDDLRRNNGLVEALEGIRLQILDMDTAQLNELRDTRLTFLLSLDSMLKYEVDTLDSSSAEFVRSFTQLGQPTHPSSVDIDPMNIRINAAIRQLLDLNHDLEHNLLPPDSVSYLLSHERQNAKALIEQAQQFYKRIRKEEHNHAEWLLQKDSIVYKFRY